MKYRVAVVGATGLVGQEFIKILEQRHFPAESIILLGSDHIAGKKLFVNHQEVEVKETTGESFHGIDVALFSAGSETSRHFSPVAVQSGAAVIDNSAEWGMDASVPVVIPEVNAHDIEWHKGIVASPGSTTVQIAMALYPLHKVNPIKRIVISTYQSVSGTGAAALEELTAESKQVLSGQGTVVPHVYPHQIAFNLLPEVDVFMDSGYSREEWRVAEETRKIMHSPELAVTATCVRVPVFLSHSASVNIELTQAMPPEEARQILSQSPGVKVLDDPVISLYPQPWAAAGTDEVYVGRIRTDASNPRGLAMWVVADNIRKGAALNAIQIAEEMVKRQWILPKGKR